MILDATDPWVAQIHESLGPHGWCSLAFWHLLRLLKHLYGKFTEKIGLKAPGNYSASFWSYNFSLCSWERPKNLISMIPGFVDASMSPKTNMIHRWRHQDTLNNPRKCKNHFQKT